MKYYCVIFKYIWIYMLKNIYVKGKNSNFTLSFDLRVFREGGVNRRVVWPYSYFDRNLSGRCSINGENK